MTTAPDVAPNGAYGKTPPELCSVHAPPLKDHGETRTRWVVALTAAMMVAELIVGYLTKSLSLTADGWHMGTHVGALGLSAIAYWYARTRAHEQRFAFGTGKVYALAGYSSAALLLVVALAMVATAIDRLFSPVGVDFADALPTAIVGLLVNLVSAKLLSPAHTHGGGTESQSNHHRHDHAPHGHEHHGHQHAHEHDHNLRAAYLHVVADALTSVLAIVALLVGQQLDWRWADPAVALVGAAIILKWGLGLMRECARQLVDLDPSTKSRDAVRTALERLADTKVCDLHLWRVGPGRLVCVVAVSSPTPLPLEHYKQAVISAVAVEHLTVEVRPAER